MIAAERLADGAAALWFGIVLSVSTSLVLGVAAAGLLKLIRCSASVRGSVWFAVLAWSGAMVFAGPVIALLPHGETSPDLIVETAGRPAHVLVSPRYAGHEAAPQPAEPAAAPYSHAVPALVAGGWALCALAGLVEIVVSLVLIARLKRRTTPLDELWRSSAWEDDALRRVQMRSSTEIAVPIAVGYRSPMIVVPHHLLSALSPDEIDHIILHELCHLRRHDDVAKLVQHVLLRLQTLNPLAHVIGAQIDLEREIACDEFAAARRSRTSYSRSLIRLCQRLIAGRGRVPSVVSSFSRRSQIMKRLLSLSEGPRRPSPLSRAVVPSLFPLALAIAVAGSSFAPSLAAPKSLSFADALARMPKPTGIALRGGMRPMQYFAGSWACEGRLARRATRNTFRYTDSFAAAVDNTLRESIVMERSPWNYSGYFMLDPRRGTVAITGADNGGRAGTVESDVPADRLLAQSAVRLVGVMEGLHEREPIRDILRVVDTSHFEATRETQKADGSWELVIASKCARAVR